MLGGLSCLHAISDARADNKYLEIPDQSVAASSRASRYANMSNAEAYAELSRRGVAFRRELSPARGVRAPIRLTGPLNGVHIRSTLPESEWATTIYNILDARLGLALFDFTRILAQHDIVELIHFTMYRSPPRRNVPQFRHPGGLAIDLGAVRKKNGEWLSIGPHWASHLGARTCSAGARKQKARRARELVSIVCEAADQRIFHYTLSPHHDAPHADHLHLEIKPGVKWFLIN